MKTAERVLTERKNGQIPSMYLTAKGKDIETIHFVSMLVNIFCDDGSVISVTADHDNPGELKYTVGKQVMEVTP